MSLTGSGIDLIRKVDIEGHILNCTNTSDTNMLVTAPILAPGKYVINMFDDHGRRVTYK